MKPLLKNFKPACHIHFQKRSQQLKLSTQSFITELHKPECDIMAATPIFYSVCGFGPHGPSWVLITFEGIEKVLLILIFHFLFFRLCQGLEWMTSRAGLR